MEYAGAILAVIEKAEGKIKSWQSELRYHRKKGQLQLVYMSL